MRFSALALTSVCALFLTVSGAKANAIGTLVVTSGTGELTVTIDTIMFGTPTDSTSNPPGADAQVASGTNLTFSGGPLAIDDAVNMSNLSFPPSFPITNWMTFPGFANLKYTVTSEGPGSSNTDCAGLSVSQTCSPFAGDPVVLELEAGNTTEASLALGGTVTDGTGTVSWVGGISSFLTNLLPNGAAPTPGNIQAYFAANPNGSLTLENGGSFTSTSVPEPGTIVMMIIGSSLIGIAALLRRRGTAK